MKNPLLPRQRRMLEEMGNQIKLARLRRNITSQEMAERTSLGRNTIVKIETGAESVAAGQQGTGGPAATGGCRQGCTEGHARRTDTTDEDKDAPRLYPHSV